MQFVDKNLSLMQSRHLGIGGSDANILWKNEEDSIYNLFLNKTGEKEQEDLSDNFPVQLGIVSEELNISWFEKTQGKKVERGGCYANIKDYKDYPYYTHTDGIVLDKNGNQTTFLECKHTNPFGSMKDKIISYLPQLQYYMMHLQVDHCYLSIIPGNGEPKVFEIAEDTDFQDTLHTLCRKFWHCVKNRNFILSNSDDHKELEKNPIIDNLKDYNMEDTEWNKIADTLDQTSGAVDIFESNKKKLKALMPADAKTATTDESNWIAIRSKNNRVSLKKKN